MALRSLQQGSRHVTRMFPRKGLPLRHGCVRQLHSSDPEEQFKYLKRTMLTNNDAALIETLHDIRDACMRGEQGNKVTMIALKNVAKEIAASFIEKNPAYILDDIILQTNANKGHLY